MSDSYKSLYNEREITADTIFSNNFAVENFKIGNTTIEDRSTIDRTVSIPISTADCDFVLTDDQGQIIGGDNTFTGINSFSNTDGIKVDKINEYTTDHGVIIEDVQMKDGKIIMDELTIQNDAGYEDILSIVQGGEIITSQGYQTIEGDLTVEGILSVDNEFVSSGFNSFTRSTNQMSLKGATFNYTGTFGRVYNIPETSVDTNFIVRDTLAGTQTINGALVLPAYTNGFLKASGTGSLSPQLKILASDINSLTSTAGQALLADGAGNASFQTITVPGATSNPTPSTLMERDTNGRTGVAGIIIGSTTNRVIVDQSGTTGTVFARIQDLTGMTNSFFIMNEVASGNQSIAGAISFSDIYSNSSELNIYPQLKLHHYTTAGILKNNSVGLITSSLINNTDVDSGISTSGHVLTSNGSGAALWSAIPTQTPTLQDVYDNSSPSNKILLNSTNGDFSIQGYDVGRTEFLFVLNDYLGSSCFNVRANGQINSSLYTGNNKVLRTDPSGNIDTIEYRSTNLPSTIVQRDASGNFSASTITATLNGNASTATNSTNSTNATNVDLTTPAASTSHYLLASTNATGNDRIRALNALNYSTTSDTLFSPYFSGVLDSACTAEYTPAYPATGNGIATYDYANSAVSSCIIPTVLYTTGGYIVSGSAAGEYRCITGQPSRTGGGNASAYVFQLVAADFPTIIGKTAKLRCRYTVINNGVLNPMGAGNPTITVRLREITAVGGATTNISYTVGATAYGSQSFIVNTASVVTSGTSATFAVPANGAYMFTFTNSANLVAGNISVTATLQLIYE